MFQSKEIDCSAFGYDTTKHMKGELIRHLELQELKYPYLMNTYKSTTQKHDLVFKIERLHALVREKKSKNDKSYLEENFDPASKDITRAMLRQILAQHDIEYPKDPKKQDLINVFKKNLPKLRHANKSVSRHEECPHDQSLTRSHQTGQNCQRQGCRRPLCTQSLRTGRK